MRNSPAIAPSLLPHLVAGVLGVGVSYCAALVPQDDLIFADGFEPNQLLEVANAGGGLVTSDPVGIACGVTCSALFHDGASVTLQARTTNGSGYSFTGWSGDCAGSFRDCTVSMSAARSVTATFTSQPFNIAFVSSQVVPTNLGSAGAYDAECNTLATAAGINNGAGNAFVAWLSSFTSSAASRIGTARGWVRIDGVPFADQASALLGSNKVFNAIERDEFGASVIAQQVLTGTQPNGALGAGSCVGWTSTSGLYNAGDSSGGPIAWTSFGNGNCSQPARTYCLMNTMTAALTPPTGVGRKLWITGSAFLPGSPSSPDAACNVERPPGVASAKAVIATAVSSAANALSPAATYVRPDGQIVGTGGAIALTQLRTGIWQTASGAYLDSSTTGTWTGDTNDLTMIGTLGGTCMGWTSSSGNGGHGVPFVIDARWWNNSARACTSTSTRLICAEQ